MTATDMLTDIYLSQEVKDCIKKLRPEHLQQDILQHTFLELYEKPVTFIEDLHNRGKLKAYIVKILYNTATYSRTRFAKEQGKETPTDFCQAAKYEVLTANDEYIEKQQAYEDVTCAMGEMHWYKVELLKMYAELGTYKAVSDQLGIPLTSVFITVTEAKKEIKQRI